MGPPIKDALNMVPLGLAASKAETAASAEAAQECTVAADNGTDTFRVVPTQ